MKTIKVSIQKRVFSILSSGTLVAVVLVLNSALTTAAPKLTDPQIYLLSFYSWLLALKFFVQQLAINQDYSIGFCDSRPVKALICLVFRTETLLVSNEAVIPILRSI